MADRVEQRVRGGGIRFEVPAFEVCSYEELQARRLTPTYPVFIRPTVGIRSEWARAIHNPEDLERYIADVVGSGHFARTDRFLIESLLVGHEVDVDLVLHRGGAAYARVSDNFPVRAPFALETGHLMPSILPQGIQGDLVEVARRGSLACGFSDGNIHAELLVTPDARVFTIEINGRLGGMYIADWHRQIWGVDLVLAELAVSIGRSPDHFVRAGDATSALAQLCIISAPNSNHPKVYFDHRRYAGLLADSAVVEGWYDGPQEEDLPVCGPLNLGALTVEGRDPRDAFDSLADAAARLTWQVTADHEAVGVDLGVIGRFGSSSPDRRYAVRRFEASYSARLMELLSQLTPRAGGAGGGSREPIEVDPATTVLCAVDRFRPGVGIIGTISVHFWMRIRPGMPLCAYLHDLVVQPEYRGLGIARCLERAAVELASSRGCYKAHLDCDPRLRDVHAAHGFEEAAICMVRYFD